MSPRPSTHPNVDDLALARWRQSGLDELTGPEGGPGLGPPSGLVERLDATCQRIGAATELLGRPVTVDGLSVLAERAALLGLRRRGQVSSGGACHLVRASDGWFAVSLSRAEDWELLPAWIGLAGGGSDRWDELHERCAGLPCSRIVEQGALVGLPIGALGEATLAAGDEPVRRTTVAAGGPHSPDPLRVVDLSSMWAGPLCGAVLADAGARVVKVESTGRPDGTRVGSPEHDQRLNGSKELRTLDLRSEEGVDELRRLLSEADVVIESSRPRALRQLGIRAEEQLAAPGGPRVWVSITGHGRTGEGANRVAFGDDAAVAGGLVSWWEGDPVFCGDAIADPLTGLTAAAAALEAVLADDRVLLDVAMARVAAHFAGAGAGTPTAQGEP